MHTVSVFPLSIYRVFLKNINITVLCLMHVLGLFHPWFYATILVNEYISFLAVVSLHLSLTADS